MTAPPLTKEQAPAMPKSDEQIAREHGLIYNGDSQEEQDENASILAALAAARADERAKYELAEALAYAVTLAVGLHAKHYPDVVQWKPLDDVLGVLTQIDNMAAGISAAARAEQHAEDVRLLLEEGYTAAAEFVLEQHKPSNGKVERNED